MENKEEKETVKKMRNFGCEKEARGSENIEMDANEM
jgi:hypothetical protein